ILGYAERIRSGNISEEKKLRYLNTVYEQALEIQELVDEFDEYLSYNMAKQVHTEKIDTGTLRKALEHEYEAELEMSGISFRIINNAEKASIMIDRTKMRRVFGNIIGNSVKHMLTDDKRIEIEINCDRENVYINVNDSGEGVEDEKLEIIFEPLYTSDEGRRVAGLGLAICREIVESHGGSIYAKHSSLGGLEVCIELSRVK
ncbi:MAG: HAMP domain-containing histidine kinase, partial [Clostridia bacterium]|nr:HAMP domain-containing histidine kinase [Clostridia bacterium]